jgi:hypothetical protein
VSTVTPSISAACPTRIAVALVIAGSSSTAVGRRIPSYSDSLPYRYLDRFAARS